ncbi:MAG: PAS domain S-box protein, partial [Chloroflexi bacterium]|nr:PAS domain S-box protein [Chloroflexota bacterium]
MRLRKDLLLYSLTLSQAQKAMARLAAIVESSDDAIIGKTLDGVIVTWNAGAERLYGYSLEEVVGKNISLLVPPGRANELPEILQRLARGERVEHYETARARKNGSMLDVSVTASPIRDVDGNIIGASTIARDVTYRRRIEQQLADAHLQLAEAHEQLQAHYAQLEERVAVRTADLTMTNKHLKQEIEQRQRTERWLEQKNIELSSAKLAKERFLSAMGHEFRRAVNVVVGFNDALSMLPGPFTKHQEEQLRTIRRNAQLLPSVISDLLDLAEIESGTLQIRTEPVDPASVAREVTALLRPIAEQKGLKFIDNIPDERIILHTDRRVLRRILLNLTNYAVSFTEMGTIRLEYTRGQEAGETVTEISVVGTGSSIREEHQRKIAEAFRQLDT